MPMLRLDEVRPHSLTAFGVYLRTGRCVAANDVQVKFNPWHDPDDGRFTFAGSGRYYPAGSRSDERLRSESRGGGGNFGGGGAAGSWEPSPRPQPGSSTAGPRPDRRSDAARSSGQASPGLGTAGAHAAEAPAEQRLRIEKNGYQFQIDAQVRPRRISGQLTEATGRRSRSAQAQAGGKDRRRTDDGGHYIAARFNGPRDAFNHFAQDANFNRGAYRALEDSWAKSIRSGHKVFVDIIPHYAGNSMRPGGLEVFYFIDGKRYRTYFPNGKGQR
jgi:hypothetical protein